MSAQRAETIPYGGQEAAHTGLFCMASCLGIRLAFSLQGSGLDRQGVMLWRVSLQPCHPAHSAHQEGP